MEFEEGMQTQEKSFDKPTKMSPHAKLILLLCGFLVLLMLVFILVLPQATVTEENIPRPSIVTPPLVIVTATPAPELSRWATDSATLKIEEQNRNLADELLNLDLTESALALPNIQTNVNFEK